MLTVVKKNLAPSKVDPDGLEAASASTPFPLVPKLQIGNKWEQGGILFPLPLWEGIKGRGM
jgi:hypothetical protein